MTDEQMIEKETAKRLRIIRDSLTILHGYNGVIMQGDEKIIFNFGTSYEEIISTIKKFVNLFHPDVRQKNNLSGEESDWDTIIINLNQLLNSISKKIIINSNNSVVKIEHGIIEEVFGEFSNNQEKDRAGQKTEMISFRFSAGKIEQKFDEDRKPKMRKIPYTTNDGKKEITLYEYEWTDNNNRRRTLYSEFDLNELFRFKDTVLSPENLQRIALNDYENPKSQYGYAGMVDKNGSLRINGYVKNYFRMVKNNREASMFHNSLILEKLLDENGRQITCQGYNGCSIYFYKISDNNNGSSNIICSVIPFKTLCKQENKKMLEDTLLSKSNIKSACKSYDARDKDARFGYVDIDYWDNARSNLIYVKRKYMSAYMTIPISLRKNSTRIYNR